jgi:hypothetical protein
MKIKSVIINCMCLDKKRRTVKTRTDNFHPHVAPGLEIAAATVDSSMITVTYKPKK